ncbi:hypothetical protein [Jatrophihabitans fulvus]
MRNPAQVVPDHPAILAMLGRAVAADPAGVPPGTVVTVSGTAAPGPGGVLTAPLSGRPCVWYRALVVDFAPFSPLQWQSVAGTPRLPPVIGSDCGFLQGDRRTDDESSAPIAVHGPNGAVLVDPVRADVDAVVVSVDDAQGEYRVGDYRLRREWIIEPDAPVFAAGPVVREADGTVLRADPQQCVVVSARGERAAVDRSRSVAAGGALPAGPAAPHAAARSRTALLVGLGAAGVGVIVIAVLLVALLAG